MSNNDKKNQTLGMPHGTACGRLRKNILFHLLQKHGEDVCIRCNKKIETVSELSIEHIKPWEGISSELFWDVDNIAFSHIKCNVPHRHNMNQDRKMVMPEGKHWCRIHKEFLPVENFSRETRRESGLRNLCKQHQHYYRD